MKNLILSVLILTFIACEQGAQSGAENKDPANSVENEFVPASFTSDYYGTYSTGCRVGIASNIGNAQDIEIDVEISELGITMTERFYASGMGGCAPANLLVTTVHQITGDIVNELQEDGITETLKLEAQVDSTDLTVEHAAYANYNCGVTIVNVGDTESVPANGCDFSRVDNEYEFNFSSNGSGFTISDGNNILDLMTNTLDFN